MKPLSFVRKFPTLALSLSAFATLSACLGGGGSTTGGGAGAGATESGIVDSAIDAGPYAITYASKDVGIDSRDNVAAMFDANNAMTNYQTVGGDEDLMVGTNLIAERAGDAQFNIGRWNGGTTDGTYFTAPDFVFTGSDGFTYALVVPTTSLPTCGTYIYSLATAGSASTGAPTVGNSAVEVVQNASLTVTFAVDPLDVEVASSVTLGAAATGPAGDTVSLDSMTASPRATRTVGPIFPVPAAPTDRIAPFYRVNSFSGSPASVVVGFFSGADAEAASLSFMEFNGAGGSDGSRYASMVLKRESKDVTGCAP